MKFTKASSLILVLLAYVTAVVLAFLMQEFPLIPGNPGEVFMMDLAATVVIFLFSILFNNSSIYDPYWSVVPPLILYYWFTGLGYPLPLPLVLLFAVVLLWSLRLTSNWVRDWNGMGHEDWRYVEFRERFGPWYWLASFGGIHLFPTLIVFLGLIPVWIAIQHTGDQLTLYQVAGLAVAMLGTLLELISDEQLRKFRRMKRKGETIRSGLWKYSRHPNYLGEILFWTGLWIFGISSTDNYWWTIIAPLSMAAMFIFVSAPWMERKIIKNRPSYLEYRQEVPLLLPVRMGRNYKKKK